MNLCFVPGTVIGGETANTSAWRRQVAEQTRQDLSGAPTGIRLDFCLTPRRRVDLDNLCRPALEGLRDAGLLSRGFVRLECLVATKIAAHNRHGLEILTADHNALLQVPLPGCAAAEVTSQLIPKDGARDTKIHWMEAIRDQCQPLAPGLPVFLDVRVKTSASLVGLLKPIIDGMEPILGTDARGGMEFRPDDDRVVWLRVARDSSQDVAIRMKVGILTPDADLPVRKEEPRPAWLTRPIDPPPGSEFERVLDGVNCELARGRMFLRMGRLLERYVEANPEDYNRAGMLFTVTLDAYLQAAILATTKVLDAENPRWPGSNQGLAAVIRLGRELRQAEGAAGINAYQDDLKQILDATEADLAAWRSRTEELRTLRDKKLAHLDLGQIPDLPEEREQTAYTVRSVDQEAREELDTVLFLMGDRVRELRELLGKAGPASDAGWAEIEAKWLLDGFGRELPPEPPDPKLMAFLGLSSNQDEGNTEVM